MMLIIVIVITIAIMILLFKYRIIFGIIKIQNNEIAILEKRWSVKGSLSYSIIALNGEAGYQPEILRGGTHFKFIPNYKIHKCSLVTIPQGRIGYVFARDGAQLDLSQKLGKIIPESKNFQDVRSFLVHGGQKGAQRGILREGTYSINLIQFIIVTEDKAYYLPINPKEDELMIENITDEISNIDGFKPIVIKGTEYDVIGVVTTHEGRSLNQNDTIAPTVGNSIDNSENYHDNFQDIEKFLKAGGYMGMQNQILLEGTYYINRLFATVKLIKKTLINENEVGVVISYFGKNEVNKSTRLNTGNELVKNGSKGIWEDPLEPNKYPLNTHAVKVIKVPTTNFLIRWASDGDDNNIFGKELSKIRLITNDGFYVSLPLNALLRIDKKKAPIVIQRFGEINNLIYKTINPMVSTYFKNIGQTKTIMQLIQEREEIQHKSLNDMKKKFSFFHLDLEDVLIGTPSSPEIDKILEEAKNRQIAHEQEETFEAQRKAAEKKKSLIEAHSRAEQEKYLIESEVNIEIEKNKAEAEYKKSIYESDKIKLLAEAHAYEKNIIGKSVANTLEENIRAYGKRGEYYYLIEKIMSKYTSAIEKSGTSIVPKIQINTGSENGSTMNTFESLMSAFVSDSILEKDLLENLTFEDKKLFKEFKKIKQLDNNLVNKEKINYKDSKK